MAHVALTIARTLLSTTKAATPAHASAKTKAEAMRAILAELAWRTHAS